MDSEVELPEGVRDEISEFGDKSFSSAIPMGGVVRLFGDKFFEGVVTGVTFNIGRPAQYRVEWRDGRGMCERWMSLAEIMAYSMLEE